jgi:hypothetical protein
MCTNDFLSVARQVWAGRDTDEVYLRLGLGRLYQGDFYDKKNKIKTNTNRHKACTVMQCDIVHTVSKCMLACTHDKVLCIG